MKIIGNRFSKKARHIGNRIAHNVLIGTRKAGHSVAKSIPMLQKALVSSGNPEIAAGLAGIETVSNNVARQANQLERQRAAME